MSQPKFASAGEGEGMWGRLFGVLERVTGVHVGSQGLHRGGEALATRCRLRFQAAESCPAFCLFRALREAMRGG